MKSTFNLLFSCLLLFCFGFNLSLIAQSTIVKEAVKADKENPRSSTGLTKVKIGTLKYAYYDPKYTNIKHNYVYYINTDNEKILNSINKVFKRYKISVVNFHDLKKPLEYTDEQLSAVLNREGIDGFIKIIIADELTKYSETTVFDMRTIGNYTSGKSNNVTRNNLALTTYVDFFDDTFGSNPFVRVIATSESTRMNIEHKLVARNFDYMLDRLIKKYRVLSRNNKF